MPQERVFHPRRVSENSIGSLASLCGALDISSAELAEARALTASQRYEKRSVPKKDGSIRTVYKPHYLIRKIQRRINRRIFSNRSVIEWPDHLFGSIPNSDYLTSSVVEKDYVNCARQHCGAKSILTIDVKDFFDNVHYERVFGIFSEFLKYPKDVSEALADICCMGSSLVQGALTSSYIATLCLFASEGNLVKRLMQKGLSYTRLVDDITISSKVHNYDFGYALTLTEQMLNDVGLPLNRGKTRVQNVSMAPLIVHGLRVDFDQPRLEPREPKRIRAAVKNLELLAASPGYRASRAYRKDFNRCMGRVNKLNRVGHNQYGPLVERLKRILPLPSHADIAKAERLIQRLERDYAKPGYFATYWFYKRYFVASERLVILKRSFPKKEIELRTKLRAIKPPSKYE